MNIKDLIKDNTVSFSRYRKGHAYYRIVHSEGWTETQDGKLTEYEFPVPLDDIGDGTLLATDKALYFMRYIRKAIDDKTLVAVSTLSNTQQVSNDW